MGIVSQNELQKEKLVNDILKNIPGIEKKVIDEIFKLIDNIDSVNGNFSNGILTNEQLLKFSEVINTALKTAGYYQNVNLFISDFGKITINTSTLLEQIGDYKINKLPLSDIEKKWKSTTYGTLVESGINERFKTPILKILDDAISYGDSIGTAKEKLQNYITSTKDVPSKLKSYVTQTARDSVNQLQGQQMQSVANEIETSGFRYVGGLLLDSRGQCTRWIRELKGFIPIDKIEDEIKLAYKNERLKLESPKGHHWSGMMKNTTKENFLVKRGGWNCTHTAIPIRKK